MRLSQHLGILNSHQCTERPIGPDSQNEALSSRTQNPLQDSDKCFESKNQSIGHLNQVIVQIHLFVYLCIAYEFSKSLVSFAQIQAGLTCIQRPDQSSTFPE